MLSLDCVFKRVPVMNKGVYVHDVDMKALEYGPCPQEIGVGTPACGFIVQFCQLHPVQSAYRKGHSTETVGGFGPSFHGNRRQAIGLDQSAITVNHRLLDSLRLEFDVKETPLNWLVNFEGGTPTQFVKVASSNRMMSEST